MIESYEFLKRVTDSITEHIVVIDQAGRIQFFNSAWVTFDLENSCAKKTEWRGVNYLDVCDDSSAAGDEFAKAAAEGIRKVIRRQLNFFYLEYPCHSPDERRWFMMRVSPFEWRGIPYFVIAHQNITERKLAEEEVLNLSRTDGLTAVANRRYFNEFLAGEWRRCARLNLPISLAIIDIDNFKQLNDHYGHQAGDQCLIDLGATFNTCCNRPGDLVARYGGEEFTLVFGETAMEQSLPIINKLMDAVRELNIPNEMSPIKPTVTISVGLAAMHPDSKNSERELIKAADKRLYCAKENGKNRVVYS